MKENGIKVAIDPHVNNSCGFLGVTFDKKTCKFKARIGVNGIRKTLGYFNTAEEASAAYVKEKIKLHLMSQHILSKLQ